VYKTTHAGYASMTTVLKTITLDNNDKSTGYEKSVNHHAAFMLHYWLDSASQPLLHQIICNQLPSKSFIRLSFRRLAAKCTS